MVKEGVEEASIARPSMSLFLPLFLFFPLLCSSCCSAQGNSTTDALALLAFKNNLKLPSNTNLTTWNESNISTICNTWAYVVCSQQRVSELHLGGRSLTGSIAADTIGRLDALHTLSLRQNNLSGSLPSDFANLSALQKLILWSNNLSGGLPSEYISHWPLLLQLDLSFNSFSGSIPASLNSLTQLNYLHLENNLFNGTISSLNITSLQAFNVSNNHLNGLIPGTLAKFDSSCFSGNDNLCGLPLQVCSSPPAPQASKSKRNKLSKGAIVGIACSAAAAALLLLLLLVLCRKRKREGAASGEGDTRAGNSVPSAAGGVTSEEVKRELSVTPGKEGEERNQLVFIDEKNLFDLEDLLRASAEVLGKGTLGTSYKAVLEKGMIVAVKRLRDVDDSRRDEYKQRINIIGRLKHDNLVPLRAYYLDQVENLLVYDFMQNGSLSALLHGSKGEGYNAVVGWEARVRIAATSARGLAYLHAHDMVHGNLKSANVLLKSNLEACLADYCLSHILAFTPSAHLPLGYLAPEITHPRTLTPKADVFSFGVLLLELLTGKIPLLPSSSSSAPSSTPASSALPPSASRSDDPVDLPRWVQSVVHEEWTAEVFDPSLVQSGLPFNEEEMVQLLQIAMPCVAPSPDQRPSMVDVVRMIDNIRRTTDDDKSSDSYPEQYLASTSENP